MGLKYNIFHKPMIVNFLIIYLLIIFSFVEQFSKNFIYKMYIKINKRTLHNINFKILLSS